MTGDEMLDRVQEIITARIQRTKWASDARQLKLLSAELEESLREPEE